MEVAPSPSVATATMIQPKTYLVRKAGALDFSSSIYEVEDGTSPETVRRETSTGTKFTIFRRQSSEEYQPLSSGETMKPKYFVQSTKHRGCKLFRGSETAEENALMVVDGEGTFNKSSTYTELGGAKRTTRMYKTDGPDPSRLWSFDRTLIGFDGTAYRWKNSIGEGETLIRISDGAVIAFFKFKKLSSTEAGTLEVKEPVSEDFLHLILAALWIKWTEDHRRRIRRGL